MLLDEFSLPRDILLSRVLPYLNLYSLIVFSSASKGCQRIVFDDMSVESWRKIDLCGNQNITDEQLHIFLQKINARENTHTISLVGCANICGRGLKSLFGSKVLKDIDLRVVGTLPLKGQAGKYYGTPGLDEKCVEQILTSMLPVDVTSESGQQACISSSRKMALQRVAIRPRKPMAWPSGGTRSYRPGLHQFFYFYKFYTGSWKRTAADSSCRLCFVEIAESERMPCTACDKYYCNACAMPPTCSECNRKKCQWCSNITKCGRCNKQSCASHGYESCEGCDRVFCTDCLDYELENCVVCNAFFCSKTCHQGTHH